MLIQIREASEYCLFLSAGTDNNNISKGNFGNECCLGSPKVDGHVCHAIIIVVSVLMFREPSIGMVVLVQNSVPRIRG